MRAVQFQQADRARSVAERDEVLAEDAQAARQIAQFAGQNHRLPEAPQIFAAWRVRPDPGQFLVFGRPLAMLIGAEGGVQKRRSRSHDVLQLGGCLRYWMAAARRVKAAS